MGLEARLKRLEAKALQPPQPKERPIPGSQVSRELECLIKRLELEEAALEGERVASEAGEEVEPYDDAAAYGGETLEEHTARVEALCEKHEEQEAVYRERLQREDPAQYRRMLEIEAEMEWLEHFNKEGGL